MLVTVGVIVRNEARHIAETLDHLARLEFDAGKWELIVVDGHSTDDTTKIVGAFIAKAQPFSVRLLTEDGEPGHGNARNTVLDHAQSKYVAFTDGDCVVAPDWLSSLVSVLEEERSKDQSVIAAGGIRLPMPTTLWKEKLLNAMFGTFLGSGGSAGFVHKRNTFVDSLGNYNVIYLREVAQRERYRNLRVGEDFEFNRRLKRLGHRLVLSNRPKVYHHQTNSIIEFCRQMYLYGQAQARVWKSAREVRFFAPLNALFWLGVFVGWTTVYFSSVLFGFYLGCVAAYGLAVLATSLGLTLRERNGTCLLAVVLYPLQHLSFAWGFIKELVGQAQIPKERRG